MSMGRLYNPCKSCVFWNLDFPLHTLAFYGNKVLSLTVPSHKYLWDIKSVVIAHFSYSYVNCFSCRFRRRLQSLIAHKWFDYAVLLIIFVNCITLAMERPDIKEDSVVSIQQLRVLTIINTSTILSTTPKYDEGLFARCDLSPTKINPQIPGADFTKS